MAAAIKGLGHEITRNVATYPHASFRLSPFSQSKCTSRQLHFSSKHLHGDFPLPLSHQFILCHCVKDRGLGREMYSCLLILQKVTFRPFPLPNHASELSHHFSAPQFTVPKTEAIFTRKKNAFPSIRFCPSNYISRPYLKTSISVLS